MQRRKRIYKSKDPKKFAVHHRVQAVPDIFKHSHAYAKKVKPINMSDRKKFQHSWVIKDADSKKAAINETIAGEFSRLLILWAPKTRWMMEISFSNGLFESEYFILSKVIPGFRGLRDAIIKDADFIRKLREGEIEGFGDAMVVALILNNIDSKLDNVATDSDQHIVPFDGDWAFAYLDSQFATKNFKITSADLDALPALHTHYSFHWFGIIDSGNDNSHLKNEDPDSPENVKIKKYIQYIQAMFNNPNLRREINRAIMRAIVMDTRMVDRLCEYFAQGEPQGGERAAEIKANLANLTAAALKNESFCEYMLSQESKDDYDKFYDYLSKDYKPSSKDTIGDEELFETMKLNFKYLQEITKRNLDKTRGKVHLPANTEERKLATDNGTNNIKHKSNPPEDLVRILPGKQDVASAESEEIRVESENEKANLPGPNEREGQSIIDFSKRATMIKLIKSYIDKRGEIKDNVVKLNWLARQYRDPKKAEKKLRICASLLTALNNTRITTEDFTQLIKLAMNQDSNHKFKSLLIQLDQLANEKPINLLEYKTKY